ncbi:response regulator [Rapidithrix thailandica]|uniref:Response regulator n=1 Tax=Rapidithrix thailandica TaxID=413964 RepID=A0AAW9SIS4_9BACT
MTLLNNKHRILLVDDDESICYVLQSFLGKHFQVDVAHDGLHAMHILSEKKLPDLIISDIVMPNMNGVGFIEMLSKSGIYRDIPVIILSGYEGEIPDTWQNANVAKHFKKPFDPQDVLKASKEVLNNACTTK